MNIKRILSALLCAAMIMTSGAFSSIAYASELSEGEISIIDEAIGEETSQIITMDETSEALESEPEGEISIEAEPEENASDENVSDENALEEIEIVETESDEIIEVLDEEEYKMALQLTSDYMEVSGGALKWKDEYKDDPNRFTLLGSQLVIPEGATVIPAELFLNDTELETIDVTNVKTTLAKIEEKAFKGCTKLANFTAPTALKEIGEAAFSGCNSLKSSVLNNVISIGPDAFKNSGISNVSAPKCTKIGDNAFNGCSNLTSANFPSVLEIGESAFAGSTNLSNVTLTDPTEAATLKSVGDYAFKGTAVTDIDWSGYVFEQTDDNKLGAGVFQNCTSLTYIAFPAIETIPVSMCAGCSKLTNAVVNSGKELDTTTIGSGALQDCTKLSKIILPASVYKVDATAFAGDIALTQVDFKYEGSSAAMVIHMNAFPDLATPSKLKMRGYVDAVQDYAAKKEFTFESLNTQYDITTSAVKCGQGIEIALSQRKARKNDIVTVTFSTNDSSYILDEINIVGESNNKYKATLMSSTASASVFQFYMPDEKVNIQYTTVSTSSVSKNADPSNFTPEKITGDYVPDGGPVKYQIDTNGREFLLKYLTSFTTGNKNWQWLFKSNNEKVVRVTPLGVVTSIGKGHAIVTATLKGSSTKVELNFEVGDPNKIKYVAMYAEKPSRATEGEEHEDPTDPTSKRIPVINVDKTFVAKSAMTFYAYIECTDTRNANCIATPSYWTSVDTKIASVATKESYDNTMKITIPKGAIGETMISAYVLNPGEKKVNENSVEDTSDPRHTDNLAKLIIRVVDASPRLVNKSFTVDYNSSIGTKLEMLEVYGELGEIVKEGIEPLKIVQKKTVNGETKYVTLPDSEMGISFYYNEDNVNPEKTGFYAKKRAGYVWNSKTSTYKNMYLEGAFEKRKPERFQIPLGEVKITNSPLSPAITLSGKINTFYGKTADGPENRGKVTVTQSIKNIEVDHAVLCDNVHYQNPDSPLEDLFDKNFNIEQDKNDNTKLYITIDNLLDELKKDEKTKKEVVSGYLKIYYKGYENPVSKAITVSCGDTAPSYVLSETSGTLNLYAKNQKAKFYLYKRGDSKKIPIDLKNMTIKFNQNKTTTGSTFVNTINVSKRLTDDEYDYNLMTISQDNTQDPVGGKAVINIHHKSWAPNKTIDYTYSVSVTKSKPTAKFFGSNTATINLQIDMGSDIYIYSSQDNVPISENSTEKAKMFNNTTTDPTKNSGIKYTGNLKNAKMAAAADYMIASMKTESTFVDEPTTGKRMLKIPVSTLSSTVKGRYTFKIWPVVEYQPDPTDPEAKKDPDSIDPITFAVNVVDSKVTLSMGSNFTFNKDCFNDDGEGQEEVIVKYTLRNIPSGTKQRDYGVDLTSATFEKTNTKIAKDFDAIKTAIEFYPDPDEDKNICYSKLQIEDTKKRDDPYSYTYLVKGATLCDIDGKDIGKIADFKITVVTRNTTSSLSVTQSGSINMVDYYNRSFLTYTATPRNFYTDIENVIMHEIDEYGNEKASEADNEFFKLKQDPDNDKKVYVYLKKQIAPEKRVVPGKKYKIRLRYKLSSRPTYTPAFDFTITIKQTFPSVTVKQDINKIFAGQAAKTIKVKVKPSKDSDLASMTGVDFKDGKNDAYYQAFAIDNFNSFIEEDGYGNPMYIDNTTPGKGLKIYATFDKDGSTPVLKYVDTKIDRIIYGTHDDWTDAYYWKYNDRAKDPAVNEKIHVVVRPDYYYTFELTLKNPAALALDKTHKISMVCEYEDQAYNTKGSAFTVSVNVNK